MKLAKVIVLGVLAVLFGIYAMVLDLRGIPDQYQITIAVMLVMFVFLTL
ncbi:MAG: hypothetical protein LBF77_06105 [Spirochaetaceae bacterium]|jgi:hypothetical protein|nr:hypothetical protein [Spirochaetaceae bacterium]